MDKSELRQRLRRTRRALDEATRVELSARCCEFARGSRFYRRAKNIACYVPFDGEASPEPLVAQALADGKNVFLPLVGSRKPQPLRFARLDADGRRISGGPLVSPDRLSGDVRRGMLLGNVVPGTAGVVVRRECFDTVGFFDESLDGADDWEMWIYADGVVRGLSDAIGLLHYKYLGATEPPCLAACDFNADGALGLVINRPTGMRLGDIFGQGALVEDEVGDGGGGNDP